MPDQGPVEAVEPVVAGASRRGMLRGAAGIGAAGLAASVLAGTGAGKADAAVRAPDAVGAAGPARTVTVHIQDSASGVIDVFHGTGHVRFTDRALAARIARAAG